MKFGHFFVEKPIFATVLSILIIILGTLSYLSLPISQYPEVVPPTIQVIATYPGANAETVAGTVATPLEQEINGVENMLYMSSQSTNDGRVTITITFKLGTDLDIAQVLVQNRVAIAEPRLPEDVRRLGVTTKKNSPDMLLVVNMYSPNATYDQTYMANYATLQIRDKLSRISGVGDVAIYGASQYSMRIWLDPDRIAALGLTAGEVLQALRSQNVQVSSGTLNQLPAESQNAFELNVQTQGRLTDPEQFADIILKESPDGRLVRLKDVGHVKLGAESYTTKGYLGIQGKVKQAIALPIFQRPGSNAIETAKEIKALMIELSKSFPPDLKYAIVYNPTDFVQESVDAVLHTILEALFLVVMVILIFLQSWRAAIIPVLAIPVSLIGTFAAMSALGISLNNLSLFGLVLAIGIVVDDAIVVVENMERDLEAGKTPLEAAYSTMSEVGGALVAMGLVLVAVFIPTTFITGMSGQFYKQFGITIAVSTMISVFVSLTLSPAMAKLLLKAKSHNAHEVHHERFKFTNPIPYLVDKFNQGLELVSTEYSKLLRKLLKIVTPMLLVYGLLMVFALFLFNKVPSGFIPAQDQGYFITIIQLPPGASLSRTDAVVKKVSDKILKVPGIVSAVVFTGLSPATFTNASNAAAIFARLVSFNERKHGEDSQTVLDNLRKTVADIDDAFIVIVPPPPVRGIGSSGGFKFMIQNQQGRKLSELENITWALAMAANQEPEIMNAFTLFETKTPSIYLDIDYERARKLGVEISSIYQALEIYFGSAFVNDFNYLGRTYRVTAQADIAYRMTPDDLSRVRIKNASGDMVPIGSVARVLDSSGPSRVERYNLYPAAALQGDTKPGYSSGQALDKMEALAKKILPKDFSFEWTELAYQQRTAGNTGVIAFVLAVVFVFLLLAAQYESWILPLSVILIVPMCLLSAIVGVALAGQDNNILTQIGLVVLVGLASKNAILIVEFAKQKEEQGLDIVDAAVEAARLRLRPILMTAFAFILGVLPLVFAHGAGAEMRRALGTAVFSGMLGVTMFGLIFTPIFYVVARKLGQKLRIQ